MRDEKLEISLSFNVIADDGDLSCSLMAAALDLCQQLQASIDKERVVRPV